MKTRNLLPFFVPIVLVGCLPIEHTETAAPKLDVVLRDHGRPLADIEVHRTRGQPEQACGGGEVARTDADGRVRFERLEHREKYVFFGDTFYFWRVGFKLPSGACLDWSGEGGKELRLECEVGGAPRGAKSLPAIEGPGEFGCWRRER